MTQCTVCHRALKCEAVEDRQRNLDIVLKAVKCVRKWIDRGVRSSAADMRLDYKRRIRRAEKLGFTSVVDRFRTDDEFRTQMCELGWDLHTIEDIDNIGALPPQETQGALIISAGSMKDGMTGTKKIRRASRTATRSLRQRTSSPTSAAGRRPSIGKESPKDKSRIGKPMP